MSGSTSASAAANVKVLTPKQERRRQFVKAFFSRKPVIVGFVIIIIMIRIPRISGMLCRVHQSPIGLARMPWDVTCCPVLFTEAGLLFP